MDARARFSSRKFWVVEQAIVLSFVLAIMGKLTAEFATIVSVAVGAYLGVNGFIRGRELANGGGEG